MPITRALLTGRRAAAHANPVVLLHDDGHQRPNLVAALPALIDFYRARGYRFVDMAGRSGLRPPPPRTVDWRRGPAGAVRSFRFAPGRVTVTGHATDPEAHRFRITVPVGRGAEAVCVTAVNVGAGARGGLGCAGAP